MRQRRLSSRLLRPGHVRGELQSEDIREPLCPATSSQSLSIYNNRQMYPRSRLAQQHDSDDCRADCQDLTVGVDRGILGMSKDLPVRRRLHNRCLSLTIVKSTRTAEWSRGDQQHHGDDCQPERAASLTAVGWVFGIYKFIPYLHAHHHNPEGSLKIDDVHQNNQISTATHQRRLSACSCSYPYLCLECV